ncbi:MULTISPECIES: hypothetical protein [unclassified Streptomyces]|uniref:hypothetical protein n=1 Tax=unclassified Streptomyces TaxID=2593676 RepID=UPI002E10950B|nr:MULTISPECIES: hypothetical protein [unclassified Streptomyces]WSR23368.1 hypothetical protein OG573_32420 [Streptomyces sp. NBC_01205]
MAHRPRRALGTATALAVLAATLTACGSDAFQRCVPVAEKGATPLEVTGSYEGSIKAEGVRLTLSSGGAMTAEKWRNGSYFDTKSGDTFDASGTWEIQRATGSNDRALVRLHFDKPFGSLKDDTLDELSIGVDATRTFLYDDFDPDVCPDFRLQLQKP